MEKLMEQINALLERATPDQLCIILHLLRELIK